MICTLSTKKATIGVALAFMLYGGAANAFALLDSWTLDLTTVGPENLTDPSQHIVSNIEQITFKANFLSRTLDTGLLVGIPEPGEFFRVTANGRATDFFDEPGNSIRPFTYGATGLPPMLPDPWELTFTFDVEGRFTALDGEDLNFTHTVGGPTGATNLLELYADNLSDGTAANTKTGVGVTDGTKIATFLLRAGDGGVFDFSVGDGADNAVFELISNPFGAFQDSLGNALETGFTFATTDGNFDSDAGAGPFSSNYAAFDCGNSPVDFCGEEDGSFRIATIPEPATLVLFGLGLLGLGIKTRRRTR